LTVLYNNTKYTEPTSSFINCNRLHQQLLIVGNLGTNQSFNVRCISNSSYGYLLFLRHRR